MRILTNFSYSLFTLIYLSYSLDRSHCERKIIFFLDKCLPHKPLFNAVKNIMTEHFSIKGNLNQSENMYKEEVKIIQGKQRLLPFI